ncbi:YggT family protein [Nocardioides sambongensis]|uniref:YggT family protein n=1 Tax=Nocardioides sambongensis TaxID=2589074 RepID=UPI00112A56B1|nr:YggT family protein [Nocardioides sambongensis]
MSDPVVPPAGPPPGGHSSGYPAGGAVPAPAGPAPEEPSLHSERKVTLVVGRVLGYAVYAYVIVAVIILGLGFVLLLLGANPSAGFVEWVYRALDRAMQPFADIFAPMDLGLAGGNEVDSVLDTSVLFAMLVYAIVGFAARALLDWLAVRIQRLDHEYATYQYEAQARDRYQAQYGAQQAPYAPRYDVTGGSGAGGGAVPPTAPPGPPA